MYVSLITFYDKEGIKTRDKDLLKKTNNNIDLKFIFFYFINLDNSDILDHNYYSNV